MDKTRAHLYVKGRVQGVFYRAFTEQNARALGLSGWVRNLPDGRVEAVMEGRKDAVERAIDMCRMGPPGARVEAVEVKWEEGTSPEFPGFTVKH